MEEDKSIGMSKPMVLVFGLIVLIVIGISAFLLRDRFIGGPIEPSPTPLVESPIIESSPIPEFERSKYTLRILNGTKTSGLGASVSAKLKDLGYQIEKTGNATNSAFPRTIVRVKSDLSELMQQLIKDLSADYDASEGATLKNSDTADGEVIVGAK